MSAPSRRLELGRVGESVRRIDAVPRSRASSPTRATSSPRACLYGHTVRSPHSAAQGQGRQHRRGEGHAGRPRRPHPPRCPGEKRYGLEFPTSRSSPWTRCATSASRSRSLPPSTRSRRAELRQPSRSTTSPRHPLADPEKAPEAVRELTIRHGDPDAPGEVTVSGYYELGIQGPGLPRARVGPGRTGRQGRGGHLRRHAVAARRPRPGCAVPRPPALAGAHPPRRRRGCLRGAGRPLHADPRGDAGAEDEPPR
jgi:hypothetical protein